MGRINVTSRFLAEPLGASIQTYGVVLIDMQVSEQGKTGVMEE